MILTKSELMALLAMSFALFMDGIDANIVSLALPSLADYFDTDTNTVAWVTITYFMMVAGLMLTFGRIASSGHIKKMYMAGFAIFTISSAVCGMSEDLGLLIAARCVQGVGAAILAAVAPMICVKFISASNLGLAFSALILSGALGFGCGPGVGGLILDTLSWHWVFYINIPLGFLAIFLASKGIPKDCVTNSSKVDYRGSALIFVAVVAGIYVLEMFSREGQGMICLAMGLVMIASTIALVMVEKRSENPIIRPSLFKGWRFNTSVLCYLLLNLAYMGISYVIPFYIMKELSISYSMAGLILLMPYAITVVLSLPMGRYCDVHGRTRMAVLTTVLLAMMSVGYYLITPDMGWMPLIPIGALMGILWGICGASLTSLIVDLAPSEERNIASTMTNFIYYTGGAVGTALFASLVAFGSGAPGVSLEILTPAEFMSGYSFTMLCAVIISILTVVMICTVVSGMKKKADSSSE